jgi:hypothetical protein
MREGDQSKGGEPGDLPPDGLLFPGKGTQKDPAFSRECYAQIEQDVED